MRVGVVCTFFLSSIFSLLFLCLWETARYRLKNCLKGPLNPKQLTNQIQSWVVWEHQSIAAAIFILKFWTKCLSKYKRWSDYSFYDSGFSFTTLVVVWNLQNSFPAGSFPKEIGYTFQFLLYFSMNYRDFSVKSKLIISLFQTVKLSLSISLFQKIVFSSNSFI